MAHPKSALMRPLPGEDLPVHNRPDEWKIEQGLSAGKLPILDQTGPEPHVIQPQKWPEIIKDEAAIKAVGVPEDLFQRERDGWKGYVEWEKYPEKKEKAHKILTLQTSHPTRSSRWGRSPTRTQSFLALIGNCGTTP
ncbi:hypothetical protein LTR06_011338 [Exophiala xenobiotica]|nr:hypothetical protein LTR06_011338 [Exophiala xenobiotica]